MAKKKPLTTNAKKIVNALAYLKGSLVISSQVDVCRKTGIKQSRLSQVLSGQIIPTEELMNDIESAFNISLSDFIKPKPVLKTPLDDFDFQEFVISKLYRHEEILNELLLIACGQDSSSYNAALSRIDWRLKDNLPEETGIKKEG